MEHRIRSIFRIATCQIVLVLLILFAAYADFDDYDAHITYLSLVSKMRDRLRNDLQPQAKPPLVDARQMELLDRFSTDVQNLDSKLLRASRYFTISRLCVYVATIILALLSVTTCRSLTQWLRMESAKGSVNGDAALKTSSELKHGCGHGAES